MLDIFTIARNTFKETIRDRMLFSIIFLGVLFIALTFFLATISLDQDKRVMMDFGLAGILFFGLFVGIFIGANLLHKELVGGIAFLIFPKPLSRGQYLIGKFLGLSLTILTVVLILTAIFSAGYWFQTKGFLAPVVYLAIFASYLEVLIIVALAIMFGSFTSPINSSLYTFALFISGHSYSMIMKAALKSENQISLFFSKTLYYLLPNLEKFNLRPFAVYNLSVELSQIALITAYAVVYIALLLLIAAAALKKREF